MHPRPSFLAERRLKSYPQVKTLDKFSDCQTLLNFFLKKGKKKKILTMKIAGAGKESERMKWVRNRDREKERNKGGKVKRTKAVKRKRKKEKKLETNVKKK